jgi:hypothetical protein
MKKSSVFVTWLSLTFLIGSILFFVFGLILGDGAMLATCYILAGCAIVLFALNHLSIAHGLWVLWIGHSFATLNEKLESYPRLKKTLLFLFWLMISVFCASLLIDFARKIQPTNKLAGETLIFLAEMIVFGVPLLILKVSKGTILSLLYGALAGFAGVTCHSIWVTVLILTPGTIFAGWKLWTLRKEIRQLDKEIMDRSISSPTQVGALNQNVILPTPPLKKFRNHLHPRISDEQFADLVKMHPDLSADLQLVPESCRKSVLLARIEAKDMISRLQDGLDHIDSWVDLKRLLEALDFQYKSAEEIYFD